MDALCGAILDREATERYCLALAKAGQEPLFSDARPDLKSWGDEIWKGRGYAFLWDAEIAIFGKPLPSWVQTFGTCVGQGHGRAQQDSYFWSLAYGELVGRPVMLAWEPVYGRSRTLPGLKRWSGDGSCGVHAAQAAHDSGIVCRGTYGTVDLSSPREDLARVWAENGVPRVVLDAAAQFTAEACMRCMTTTDVRNALLAGFGVARCADRATGTQRDADGMARPVKSGGHCQCLRGVFRDIKGRMVFVEQQSWPAGACPSGGGPLKLYSGKTKDLPPGAAGIYEDDVDYYCRTGEVWAIAPPKRGWSKGMKPSEVA